MADGHHGDIYIIKKKVSGGHGHHGGAWKIAFADFMTAMMAFFLVLWIINASDKDTKTVIARYFNPVKLENPAKAKKGVRGSTAAQTEGDEAGSDKSPGPPSKKKDPKGAPPSSAKSEAGKSQAAKSEAATSQADKSQADKSQAATSQAAKSDSSKPTSQNNMASANAQMQAAEAQLFSSPYEALDRIAGGVGQTAPGASPELGDADPQRLNGALSIDAFRDPFKPIGPGSPDDPAAFDADARSHAAPNLEPGKTGQQSKPALRPLADAKRSPRPHEKLAPGDALKRAPTPAGGEAAAQAATPRAKAAEAARIEKEIERQVAAVLKPGAGPDVEAKETKDGLLISLTDKLDFSMFAIGSARPAPELVRAMAAVAKIVKARPGPIIVRGFTDARPYHNGAYDNWRLSSDRAQMAYYMLTRGGAPAARFERVEGYADRAPRDAAHPFAAVNRRLEILIEGPKS